MSRLTYTDGRTALTTTAFRYKLTTQAGVLVKDWTTGATWTEEPAGTYYLDDADAVPGTVYAVEPATGEVGGIGQVPWDEPLAAADYTAPLDATATANAAATGADAALTAAGIATVADLPPDPLDATETQAAAAAALAAAEAPPAGYTRVTSATYGTLRAGSVIDAYATTDTTYSTPLVDNAVAASNGSWAIDLPDDGAYTLVARLTGYDDVTTGVTT